ncbi:MAG: hypothetical protein FJ278_02455, partial [Planctomycetes bacterium]|nr:hypothetical protein [Planctomycetota bacterium]
MSALRAVMAADAVSLDFSKSPEARVEDLGVMVQGRTFEGCDVGPSSDGDGWSAYCLYRDHIVKRDPWTIHSGRSVS